MSYDPCYHQFCDSLAPQDFQRQSDPGYYQRLYTALDAAYNDQLDGNVNTLALHEMSDAIAHGTLTFAQSTSAVEGTDKGQGCRPERSSVPGLASEKGDPTPKLASRKEGGVAQSPLPFSCLTRFVQFAQQTLPHRAGE